MEPFDEPATDAVPDTSPDIVNEEDSQASTGRAKVLWDVFVFQLKLSLDGMRDIILSPISIGAALFGVIAGGDRPDQYLRRVMRFGRRSEIWINLFNYRHGSATDEFLKPLEDKIFSELRSDSWVGRANSSMNESLDENLESRPQEKPKR